MGINEPVRVCDSCYRHPAAIEKRQAKVFEKKPFEETEDAELKKAIELSLKEQQKVQVNPERNEDEEALKKAIEASLKEAGPNHMTPPQKQHQQQSEPLKSVKVDMFNPVELENIQMFHQLIGRLVRTRPNLSPEDVNDLKKLAVEMRKLQKRPTEDVNVKNQLEESIKGYELLFGVETSSISSISSGPSTTTTASVARQQIQSPPSSLTEDLNIMKNDVFGDNANNLMRGPEIGLVGTRLGSLSLENQISEAQLQSQLPPSVQQPAYHSNTPPIAKNVHQPMPLPAYHNTTTTNTAVQNQLQPSYKYDQSISPPVVQQSSYRHSMPVMSHLNAISQYVQHHPRVLPVQSTPIQMCPEMTIHPHPIHPSFTHVNPYAKPPVEHPTEAKTVKEKKEKKRSKKNKKDEKKSSDKEYRKKKKNDDEKEPSSKKSKKTKDSKKGEKRIKSIKMEIIDDKEKPTKKRSKHKEVKVKKEQEHSSSKDHILKSKADKIAAIVTNTVDEGRRSPINLIDL